MATKSIVSPLDADNEIPRGPALRNFTLIAFLCAIPCLAIAFWWPGEEPDKLRTVLIALSLHGTAVLLLLVAYQNKWIGSPSLWIIAFSIKLTLTLLVTYYVWFEPLHPDMMRVPVAGQGSQDSNLYDYYALEAARNGMLHSWDLLNFTWLSFGITSYLAAIYSVLGVSIAYVSMCNSVLSIAGLVALSASLRTIFGPQRLWDWVILAAFIPSVAYYDATPSKEPLTHACFYVALFAFVRLGQYKKFRPGLLLLLALTLGLLALVRANVAMMLVLANAWPLLRGIGLMRSFIAGGIGMLVAVGTLVFVTGSVQNFSSILNFSERINATDGFIREREEAGESGLKLLVAKTLSPQSVTHMIALSPVRAMIWFYLPYPLIIPITDGLAAPPTLLFQARLAKITVTHELAFAITGWLLMIATPSLLAIAWRLRNPHYPGLAVIFANIAVPALIIGNFMFVMGRRYRTLIEPLVLAAVLLALHFRLGRRISWPIWFIMAGGVGLTALLRS